MNPATCAASVPVQAFVALGGNLGQARETVQAAMESLAHLPHTALVRASSLYRTTPVDADGPDYINAVVELHTALGAHALLREMQGLEQAAGRERHYRNAPRTLDLDLLLYGGQRIDTPDLSVPHPRMRQRAFVLRPLAEIAPDQVCAEDLAAVAGQTIERLTL